MALNNGGCFSGDTLVSMDNDSKIHVSFLKVGDSVQSYHGDTKVEKIIPFNFTGFMYHIGKNASVSAYHPILLVNISGPTEYFFPKHRNCCQRTYYNGTVYQIVLENRSYIMIGANSRYINRMYAGTYNYRFDESITWYNDEYEKIFGHPYCYEYPNNNYDEIQDIIENDPESVITNRYH